MATYIVHSCLLLLFTAARVSALFDGSNTGPLDYTWTAWVERNGSYVCGASIISNKWVMTSGDCVFSYVDNNEGGSFNIHLGEYDISSPSANKTVVKSCNVLYNKNYNSTTNANNLGMMELEVPLNFTTDINPVPAYSSSKPDIKVLKAADCFVSGFGEDATGTLNTVRQVLPIRVRNADRCVGLVGFEIEHHVCYSTTTGGPCNLDTGSPIVCNISGVITQIAAQLDETCTTGFHYGEFTYKDRRFISEALENPSNETCPTTTPTTTVPPTTQPPTTQPPTTQPPTTQPPTTQPPTTQPPTTQPPTTQPPTTQPLTTPRNITRGAGCGPAGKSFMVAFPSPDPTYSRPTLYITSQTDATVVLETGSDISIYVMRTLYYSTASNGLVIPLPSELSNRRTGTSTYSVRIVADQDIFVMAGYEPDAIGTTQLFPEECLKNLTYVYNPVSYAGGYNRLSEVLVVAIENGTSVTMSAPINAQVTLNQFQVYRSAVDVSGATITASGPVAVFTGIECGNVDTSVNYCDTMFEQIPPTSTLQNIYIVPTNLPRQEMILRIVPVNASTTVSIKNILNATQTLSLSTAGSVTDVPFSNLSYVESSSPIILGALSYGGEKDLLKIGDPSLLIVPSINEYTSFYKIYAPPTTGYNYVTLIIRTTDDSTGLLINGAALSGITANQTINVPLYGLFDVITVLLDYGVSTIEHASPVVDFGVVQYNLQFYRETASAPRKLLTPPLS